MQDVIMDLTGVLALLKDGPQTPNSVGSEPSVIFFDAVGTLFGVRDGVGAQYAKCADRVGVTVSAAALDTAFYGAFKAAGSSAFPFASASAIPTLEFEWWRSVVSQTFDRVGVLDQFTEFDRFFEDVFQYFATAAPWVVYPETIAVLDALQTLGISLGILSNFDSRIYAVLKALGLDQYFQSVTISTEVGMAKPDREIFRVALEKCGCAAGMAWHVGDSWKEDYEGSIAVGMRGIWVDRD